MCKSRKGFDTAIEKSHFAVMLCSNIWQAWGIALAKCGWRNVPREECWDYISVFTSCIGVSMSLQLMQQCNRPCLRIQHTSLIHASIIFFDVMWCRSHYSSYSIHGYCGKPFSCNYFLHWNPYSLACLKATDHVMTKKIWKMNSTKMKGQSHS